MTTKPESKPGALALASLAADVDAMKAKAALADLRALMAERDALLKVAEEIALSGCDLGDSERRIRLYAAITNAGGTL